MNPFQNIITSDLKQLYNHAIDAIIDPSNGLVNRCTVRYGGIPSQQTVCNNCLYDSISQLSSNIYNGTGPKPFIDGGVCPVCLGSGSIKGGIITKEEVLNLAVIMDSKYFINIANSINLNNNHIQTICKKNLAGKLSNCLDLVLHGISYQKAGEPQYCGLAEHEYVIILWSVK
jgi:hypothetical protein